MPKLFVPKDYVDSEIQKLRQELLELRTQVSGSPVELFLSCSGAEGT